MLRPSSENELKKIIKEVHEVDQSIMLGDQPDVNAISMEDDVLEILGQLRVAAEVQERAALHEGPGAERPRGEDAVAPDGRRPAADDGHGDVAPRRLRCRCLQIVQVLAVSERNRKRKYLLVTVLLPCFKRVKQLLLQHC